MSLIFDFLLKVFSDFGEIFVVVARAVSYPVAVSVLKDLSPLAPIGLGSFTNSFIISGGIDSPITCLIKISGVSSGIFQFLVLHSLLFLTEKLGN